MKDDGLRGNLSFGALANGETSTAANHLLGSERSCQSCSNGLMMGVTSWNWDLEHGAIAE